MSVLNLADRFEYVGNRFKNPDLIRFFNSFCRYFDENEIGIGRIRSQNQGEFFSQDYLDFLSNTLGTERGLRDFLAWLREELLIREHIRQKLCRDYTPRQFVEILFLLFNNQKNLEYNPEKPSVEDIFSGKVCDVLDDIDTALSREGFDIFERLERTINKGFFPISSQGELLLFVSDTDTGKAEFLSFPSSSKIIANTTGGILEVISEPNYDEVNDKDSAQEDFLDWFFTDTEPSDMLVEELRLRLTIYEKWMKFHRGEGQILSKNEHEAYLIEFDTCTEDLHEANSLDEISSETKKYIDTHFTSYIENTIMPYMRSLLRDKIGITVIK